MSYRDIQPWSPGYPLCALLGTLMLLLQHLVEKGRHSSVEDCSFMLIQLCGWVVFAQRNRKNNLNLRAEGMRAFRLDDVPGKKLTFQLEK